MADHGSPEHPQQDDEFYVGYLPEAPHGIASIARLSVMLIVLVGLAAAALLVTGQRPFPRSHFEFGIERDFEGVVTALPHPALWVERPGSTEEGQRYSRFALVAQGKFGAEGELAGLDGKPVRLRGTLIYRSGHTMVEIVPDSAEALTGDRAVQLLASAPSEDVNLGVVTLEGEIVDAKCFYGVMKPGNLKPHRACATRCISGGIPPMLLVREPDGSARYLLLVSDAGDTVNQEVLDMVAEPLSITGRVVRRGDLLLLMANPSTYQRIESLE